MTPNPLRWTPKMREMYGKVPYDLDDEDGFNVRLREYAETVRQIAKTESVALIDVYQNFKTFGKQDGQTVDDLLLDGIHPNERGHRLVSDQLLAKLRNADAK
jgi:lysophospholipase L1-like esterase